MPDRSNNPTARMFLSRPVVAVIRMLRGFIVTAAMLGVACYGAAALLTVADIVGRRFGLPIVGVIDLVQLCVIAGAWLVIPYAFLVGAHVGVDLVVEKLPSEWRKALRAFAVVVTVVLLTTMLLECAKTYQQQALFGDRSQQLGIPITWYWLPLLVGMGLSILAAALTIIEPPKPKPSA